MANEERASGRFQYTPAGREPIDWGYTAQKSDATGNDHTQGSVTASVSGGNGTAIGMANVGTPGKAMFHNTSADYDIEILDASNGNAILEILAGQEIGPYQFPRAVTAPHARSKDASNTAVLEYLICEK